MCIKKNIISKSLLIVLLLVSSGIQWGYGQGDWKAPAWTDTLKNSVPESEKAIRAGKRFFNSICKTCHGEKGKGNGIQAKSLERSPANLTMDSVQQQSDGAIFWKISEGNPPMLSFRSSMSKKQRWQIVHYVRKLAEKYPPPQQPSASTGEQKDAKQSADQQGDEQTVTAQKNSDQTDKQEAASQKKQQAAGDQQSAEEEQSEANAPPAQSSSNNKQQSESSSSSGSGSQQTASSSSSQSGGSTSSSSTANTTTQTTTEQGSQQISLSFSEGFLITLIITIMAVMVWLIIILINALEFILRG